MSQCSSRFVSYSDIERFQYPCNSLRSTLMYGSETVVSSFFVSVFAHTKYVILFVMFVFVGVNKFVTVIVLVKYLA